MSAAPLKPLAALVLFAALLAPCCAATPSPAAAATNGPDATMTAYQGALRKLCGGDAAAARTGFAAILPAMQARKYDGSRWIDFGRNYFYALLESGDTDEARRFLTSLEGDWKPSSAERLFWNGYYAGSFAAYVADDGRVQRTPDQQAAHKLDPLLAAALLAVRDGKLDDAVADMKAYAAEDSLYLLMRGNLYAQQRRWPEAFDAWVAAAASGPGSPQMEWYVFDEWNISALEMTYYYRAHAPRSWFSGIEC